MSKGPTLPRIAIALVSVLLVASCAAGPRPPLETLAGAARAAQGGGGSPRERALAAWHAWLVGADAARMETLAQSAIASNPREPWARLALAEAARRRLDPHGEARELAELIRGAPAHPLAPVAARDLRSLVSLSTALDRELEGQASALLELDGLAPDAAAALRSLLQRSSTEKRGEASAAAGAMAAAAVVGPFSAWHHLDLRTAFAPEGADPVPAAYEDAAGDRLPLRPFALPGGAISLAPEERDGDVYYALSVVQVPEGGRHLLRVATARSTSAAVFVDGAEALRREAIGAPSPTEAEAELDLSPGAHLVALRIVKGSGGGEVHLALAPADGGPSRVTWRAAREGDRAGNPPRLVGPPRHPSARRLASTLEEEGGILAAYVAAASAARVDREGAKAILDDAIRLLPGSPALLQLRAELLVTDDGIPDAIGQARAAADLEGVLARDPSSPRARSSAAAILREAGRYDEALDALAAAGGEEKAPALVSLGKARVALARGFDVQAWTHAREALAADPGLCDAGAMIFDLARRSDAAGELEDAAERFVSCPGGRARLAGVLATRGHDGDALATLRTLVAEDPQGPSPVLRLSERLLAQGDAAGAAAIVAGLERSWPRSAFLPRRRAQLLERSGDLDAARAARERTLSLDGGDLSLRRMDAFRQGTDVLAKHDRDGLDVIREFEERPRSFDTATVVLYDFGAVEAHPDGSIVERVHVISKVLDKRGVDLLGEAHVPAGAEVIHLRTIKRDGTILEPESIGGKESVSLPGLDVGDYVEEQWLLATSPRGDGRSWSASPFYFRSAATPLLESVYVVRAPKGVELDLRNGAPQPEVLEDGDVVTLRMASRNNPAHLPEPGAVPGDEFLPWVQAGMGRDEASIAWRHADALAAAVDRTAEVAAWARGVAAGVGRAGRDRTPLVRAVYDRAMEEIEGSSSLVAGRASLVLAQKRGSRALLIKAALEELGIPSQWAVVRTWDQPPVAPRFPRSSSWGYLVLVVRPDPDGGQLWLDPGVRWAPFGRVAPAAEGSPALILPDPGSGRPISTGTPSPSDAPRGRVVDLRLALGPDGTLVGEGSERYLGFDAAWARGSLENLDEDRRRQAVELALARIFRGLTLDALTVDPPEEGALTLRYRFTVAQATRDLGQGLHSLDLDFVAANLGRRYLVRGDRETPLFLRAPERVEARILLELPPSLRVVGAPDAARESGAFGDYKRSIASSPGRIAIEESLDVARGRVRPHEYREFARWVMAVDRAQSAELILADDHGEPRAAR